MKRRKFLKAGIVGSFLPFILKPKHSIGNSRNSNGQTQIDDAEKWKKLVTKYGAEFGKPIHAD